MSLQQSKLQYLLDRISCIVTTYKTNYYELVHHGVILQYGNLEMLLAHSIIDKVFMLPTQAEIEDRMMKHFKEYIRQVSEYGTTDKIKRVDLVRDVIVDSEDLMNQIVTIADSNRRLGENHIQYFASKIDALAKRASDSIVLIYDGLSPDQITNSVTLLDKFEQEAKGLVGELYQQLLKNVVGIDKLLEDSPPPEK
jgi:hypothetical protein